MAKLSIILSVSVFILDSQEIIIKSSSQSWAMVERSLVFINFSFEKVFSGDALEIGNVTPIFRTVNKFGQMFSNPLLINI